VSTPEELILQCGGQSIQAGRRCTHDVVVVIADVPLCTLHRARLFKEFACQARVPVVDDWDSMTIVQRTDHVTYYLGDPETQLVKIGTTMALFKRIVSLKRVRPRLLLLATEPGHEAVEHSRHHQFQGLHNPLPNGEKEWFRKAPVLLNHIADLRQRHGIIVAGPRPVPKTWIVPFRRGPAYSGSI
jgi:hypothetical protein